MALKGGMQKETFAGKAFSNWMASDETCVIGQKLADSLTRLSRSS